MVPDIGALNGGWDISSNTLLKRFGINSGLVLLSRDLNNDSLLKIIILDSRSYNGLIIDWPL